MPKRVALFMVFDSSGQLPCGPSAVTLHQIQAPRGVGQGLVRFRILLYGGAFPPDAKGTETTTQLVSP